MRTHRKRCADSESPIPMAVRERERSNTYSMSRVSVFSYDFLLNLSIFPCGNPLDPGSRRISQRKPGVFRFALEGPARRSVGLCSASRQNRSPRENARAASLLCMPETFANPALPKQTKSRNSSYLYCFTREPQLLGKSFFRRSRKRGRRRSAATPPATRVT